MALINPSRFPALPGLLAMLVVSALAGASPAETIVFRNETETTVVVQVACLVQGRLFRERPLLLRPGEVSPPIRLPGDKLISIYDARMPNVAVFQGAIPAIPRDQRYVIVPAAPPPRLKIASR